MTQKHHVVMYAIQLVGNLIDLDLNETEYRFPGTRDESLLLRLSKNLRRFSIEFLNLPSSRRTRVREVILSYRMKTNGCRNMRQLGTTICNINSEIKISIHMNIIKIKIFIK